MASPSSSPTNITPYHMTFDKFFDSLAHVPGGTVYMAMPRNADMSIVRLIADKLIPTAIEIAVDDEVIFLYARLQDFDADAYNNLSKRQQRIIGKVVAEYHIVLRAFLSIYTCRGYRLWESVMSLTQSNSSIGGQDGQNGQDGQDGDDSMAE